MSSVERRRPAGSGAAVSSRHRWIVVAVVLVVGLIGAFVRLRMLLVPSPLFYGTYDDGVHFSAAVNLVHGHLPYRDVVFLQPPGVLLAASPFALLANLIGDSGAFVAGRVVFALIGALNGALVAFALRRSGVAAMIVGGVLYAISFAAAYDERTITLEVCGTAGILTSLVLLDVAARRHGRGWFVLAGAMAGIAIDFKVWYVVPLIVLAVVARRNVGWFALGGVVTGAAGYVPFFAAAPAAMWKQVVLAQLGRPQSTGTPIDVRLRSMLGVGLDGSTGDGFALIGPTVVTVLLVLVAVLVLATLTVRGGRRFVLLLLGCAAVLILSPSYFQHYAVLTAAPLCLVAGVGTVRIARWLGRGRRVIVVLSVAVALVLQAAVGLRQDLGPSSQHVAPVAALQAAAARIPGCIVTDDPTMLILMDRLTPEIRDGCTVRSDPSGYGYVLVPPGGKQVFRPENAAWQRSAVTYLRSADAYILVRGKVFGLTPPNEAVVRRDPVLFEQGRFVIRTGRPTP